MGLRKFPVYLASSVEHPAKLAFMRDFEEIESPQMGERKRKLKEAVIAVKRAVDELTNHSAPMSVATAGGKFQVK
jgi:hypothetical protein